MKCPYCNSSNTSEYFSVKKMPNILSACSNNILKKVKLHSFKARLCNDCLLGFNSLKIKGSELKFIYDNYLYISPLNKIGHTKYINMLETIRRYCKKDDKLVEIGCSEGYLLSTLQQEGYTDLTGIEPGPQAVEARKLGLNVVHSYFDDKTFIGKAIDSFILMHVFEHFADPFPILKAMKKQLAISGKIIIEVPYFTGYHHQHLFFYNLTFFKKMCSDNKLKIIYANMEDDALRVVITDSRNMACGEVSVLGDRDEVKKMALNQKKELENKILKLNRLFLEKKNIFWWGAGSASVFFLNQIDENIVRRADLTIVDGDRNKWGKYIPGLNIKVEQFNILRDKKVELLIIASQLHNEISATIKEHNFSVNKIEVFA